MTDYLTQEEIEARDKAVSAFTAQLETCEKHKLGSLTIETSQARLIVDEILRMRDVEEAYDDAMSAAEDRRFD